LLLEHWNKLFEKLETRKNYEDGSNLGVSILYPILLPPPIVPDELAIIFSLSPKVCLLSIVTLATEKIEI
jgi:hypothetical protein